MRALLAAAALAFPVSVSAATIDILGAPGAGFVTLNFSGSAAPRASGTLRDTTENNYDNTDTFELDGFLIDPSVQDIVFPTTGNLSVTFNGITAAIDGIFLDEDGTSTADFGFRTDTGLLYSVLPGEDLIFSGSGTIALDINAFSTPFAETAAFDVDMFARNEMTVNINVVPLPAALPLLAGAGVALALVARRRRRD